MKTMGTREYSKTLRATWQEFHNELADVLTTADTATELRERFVVMTDYGANERRNCELETTKRVHEAMLEAAKQCVAAMHDYPSYGELAAAMEKADEEAEQADTAA